MLTPEELALIATATSQIQGRAEDYIYPIGLVRAAMAALRGIAVIVDPNHPAVQEIDGTYVALNSVLAWLTQRQTDAQAIAQGLAQLAAADADATGDQPAATTTAAIGIPTDTAATLH